MRDFSIAIFLLGVGLFFAVRCTIASRREFGNGRALGGKFGDFDRTTNPFGFWFVMAGNLAAAIMGLIFAVVGLAALLGYFGVLR